MSNYPVTPPTTEVSSTEVSKTKALRARLAGRRNVAIAAGAATVLVFLSWFVLFGGGDEPVGTSVPAAASTSGATVPATPPTIPPLATVPPSSANRDPGAGRDPFVPLVVAPAAAVAPSATTGMPTPQPTPGATPTLDPTSTPTITPAPPGKKKPVPTTGPVL